MGSAGVRVRCDWLRAASAGRGRGRRRRLAEVVEASVAGLALAVTGTAVVRCGAVKGIVVLVCVVEDVRLLWLADV